MVFHVSSCDPRTWNVFLSNNRKCIGWPKNSYATIKSFEELFSRKVSIQICALRHHAVQQALELSTIKATSGKLVMQWQFWHEVKKKVTWSYLWMRGHWNTWTPQKNLLCVQAPSIDPTMQALQARNTHFTAWETAMRAWRDGWSTIFTNKIA